MIHGYLALTSPERNGYAFAIPIGLWVGYRVALQVAVTEVPASAAQETESEGSLRSR